MLRLADDPLLTVLREGARRMLTQAVEAEVKAFLAANADLADLRSCGHGHPVELIGSDLSGCPVSMPLDDPGVVAGLPEPLQCQAELLDRLEAPQPQQVLLERADEPLGAAVALGLADEGRRALDAEEADLPLEVVADVLAAVVVAEPQPGGDVPAEGTVAPTDGLLDRLQGLEAVGNPAGMDAQALGRAVVDGDEHRRLTLAGHHRGQVGPPHQVDPLGRDRAVVGLGAMGSAGALVGQQAVLAREPQDAPAAGADAREAQPRPQLAVALAVEGAVGQELPDLPGQKDRAVGAA